MTITNDKIYIYPPPQNVDLTNIQNKKKFKTKQNLTKIAIALPGGLHKMDCKMLLGVEVLQPVK